MTPHANTPISYLPFGLTRAVPWSLYAPIVSLESFTPEAIRGQIGGGIRQAQIFAARAHEIQAADIAAGWARDLLEVSDARALGDQFERVWVNGIRSGRAA